MKKERLDKFSIRKLTVGAASVLIGVAFGATTVSAAAKPAPQQDTPASQQAAEVTELKGVKFTFKMGDKSATTRAVTIYATKDGHYGFEKDAAKCKSTAAQIVSSFLTEVTDNDIKNAEGVAYPEKINAGENTVEVAAKPASNPVEHSDADLQKEAEKKADELQNQFAEEEKAALEAAKKAAHKALNDAGITGAIFHKAIDAAKTLEELNACVAEFTYHFTYKGADTTVSTDHLAGSAEEAEQYFRAYASGSGFNLDFTYDEATHTFVGTDAKKVTPAPEPVKPTPVVPTPEPKPEETTYHFQYDDKKGNSIRQDFATTDADTAEMHFIAYASDNGLSIDLAHFAYDEATHTFVYKDFESEKVEPEEDTDLYHYTGFSDEDVYTDDTPAPEPAEEGGMYHETGFSNEDVYTDDTPSQDDEGDLYHETGFSDEDVYTDETPAPKPAEDTDLYHYTGFSDEDVYTDDTPAPKPEPEQTVEGDLYHETGFSDEDVYTDETPAVDALAEAKKAAHEEFTKAGITGKIFHDAIDAAKTVEGLQAYVAETLKAHKTVEPVTPTPAPVVSGETGIGYLNLDMLSDGFTGTLYVPVVGKDVNCKVRLLDDAGKYTNDYVVTDTTVKALASKVVNGVTFYKVAENRWIPAKFAEVLSDKEVAFKGVAKTFVKGHANYAVAMLDADGKYTGKFLKQGSSFKVFAKKVINGHLCYRLGTQAQWVPARFLVF